MAKMESGPFAYFEGKFVPIEDAKVSILTHAFNYGTGLFEGIRGFWNEKEKNIYLFRLKEHIDRFVRNFNILCMDIPETFERIEEICIESVKRNEFKQDCYVRPLCYKSGNEAGPAFGKVSSSLCCFCISLGDYVDTSSGLDVAVSSWRRVSDNAIPTRTKATGAYINSALASTESKAAGFDEAIFLREDGTVAEGSAMNIFMVSHGKIVTPPRNADILVGITRNSVIELAQQELGLEVVERPIARTELYVADEVFFTGTATHVAPVRTVDRRIIGDGKPGKVTMDLQSAYFEVVQGKNDKYRDWLTPVYQD